MQDINAVETNDILLLPGNKTVVRWSPDSIIPSYLQETLNLQTSYSVDISLYELNFDSENYMLISHLATNILNTGEYQITIPSLELSENFIVGIIGISISEQFSSVSTDTNTLLGLLKRAPKFGLIYVATSLASRSVCSSWYSSEFKDIGETIANKLPPCPPVRDAALNDPNFIEVNYLLSFFHPGASSCFQQVVFTK